MLKCHLHVRREISASTTAHLMTAWHRGTCNSLRHCVICVCAAREYIVGWYSTGPKLKASDLDINDLMSNYCSDPVLVITEVQVRRSSADWIFSVTRALLCHTCYFLSHVLFSVTRALVCYTCSQDGRALSHVHLTVLCTSCRTSAAGIAGIACNTLCLLMMQHQACAWAA